MTTPEPGVIVDTKIMDGKSQHLVEYESGGRCWFDEHQIESVDNGTETDHSAKG